MFLKSVNQLSVAGLFCLAILFGACQDEPETPSPPVGGIVYKKLLHPEHFTYGTPKVLDLDGDAVIDFQFGVILIGNELGDHYQFVISPVRANTALLNELEAIPLQSNFEIGENTQQEDLGWDIGVGKMLTKLQGQSGAPSWSGTWSDVPDGIVGIRFFIGEKAHFGWIKIGNDHYSSRMTLLEYAYNSEPGKSIKSGQTE